MIDKPSFYVPSMAEIAAVPPNGLTVVSTFSGAGGSSLGYKMAGFQVLWANEFVPSAQDVYRINHPHTILDTRDIRQIQAQDILDAVKMRRGEIDLLDGSPPCASFSTSGRRQKGWGKISKYSSTGQRTDDLFYEFARILRELQPRTFIAENVSGLITGTAKGYFIDILKTLKACGYQVEARLLDASWLGVPQMRRRIIFAGVRHDLGISPVYPKPLPYRYSIQDAIPWIVSSRYGDRYAENISSPFPVEPETDISGYLIGRMWDEIVVGKRHKKRFNLVRPAPDKPCFTITTLSSLSSAAVCHPVEKRYFSIAEIKRIFTFPDDFILTGTYIQQYERLARSVPPVMMMHIATTVRDEVLCRIK